MLGAKSFETIEDRFKFLEQRLIERFKLWSGRPDWHAKELQELGPNLQRKIKRMLAFDIDAQTRVLYIQQMRIKFTKLQSVGRQEDDEELSRLAPLVYKKTRAASDGLEALRPCDECATEFYPKRLYQRFCSALCRNKFHRTIKVSLD